MPVNTTHPDYDRLVHRWKRMDDVCAGEDAVKDAGEAYLPMANKDLGTPAVKARYEAFKDRAVFIEVTKDTLDKYAGQAFASDPILNVDKTFDYLKRNANGAGLSIYQIGQKCFISQMKHARCGLLVDHPETGGEVSIAEVEAKALRPTISFYDATSIINWRTTTDGGLTRLSMVVLLEMIDVESADDPFVTEQVEQWRYLGIDDKGYFVEVYRKNEDGEIGLVGERRHPTKHSGDKWQIIPFVILGSDTNDWSEQKIPMESLAKVNLAHYRNSAAYEDSVHYCGQIQPWMSGVDDRRLKHYEDKKVRVGSGTLLMLGDSGKFGYAQAQPNTLASEAMDKKYAVMIELGAKLAESNGGQSKTATQSNHENSAQNSTASMCIANLNEAMHDAIMFAYEFLDIEHKEEAGDYLFKAKQDFVAISADTNMLQALAALVQGNLAPKTIIYDYLRKYNLLDPEMTDDDIEGALEAAPLDFMKGLTDEQTAL